MNEVGSSKKRWLTVKPTVLYIEALGAIQSLIQVSIISYVSDPALNHQRALTLPSLKNHARLPYGKEPGCISSGGIEG